MRLKNVVRALIFASIVISGAHLRAQKASTAKPAVTSAQVQPKIQANPALWVVKGPHTTIYLFGTVHLMKPNVDWHTPKIVSALASSQMLIEEIVDLDQADKMQPLIQQLGTDPSHPLSTKISKEDLAIIDSAIKQMGAPGESVMEPMRPWLAGITLSVLPIMKAGYDPKSGVDSTLASEFRESGRPIKGLETVEEQLHYFSDMPVAEEVESLHIQLKHLDTATSDLDKMVGAWQKGDDETIAHIENDSFLTEYPALYQSLVISRNKAWTEKLVKLLNADAPDSKIFVAVGAAHLAGPDSVQKMLVSRGFTIERQ